MGSQPRASSPEPPPLWDEVIRTDDGSLTLHSPRFGQTFRSHRGAHLEANHVFVEGTGIAGRLRRGQASRVLEIGLGAGTNLGWTAASAWSTGTPLQYLAIEREPLPPEAWTALDLASWTPAPFAAAWLAAVEIWSRRGPTARRHVTVGPVTVDVWIGDVADLVADGALGDLDPVHGVYLDAFSPDVDPAAWSPVVLVALAGVLAPGGVLTTYSVRGAVRRGLRAAGLEVEKQPGPAGGKREMLRAVRLPDDGTQPTAVSTADPR